MQPEKLQAVRPVDPLPCRQWKLLKINVSESMLSPSLPMSLHARRSPSGQAHSEPCPRHQRLKIAAVKTKACIASPSGTSSTKQSSDGMTHQRRTSLLTKDGQ